MSQNPWGSGPSAVRPVRSELISPEVKASTGITYENFSITLEKLLRPRKDDIGQMRIDVLKQIIDVLYNAVRLRQWRNTTVNASAEAAYQIQTDSFSNTRGSVAVLVLVTAKTVEAHRGLIRQELASGIEAASLFNSIKHAQNLIREATGPLDNTSDEDFFQPVSDEEQAAQLDSVLADEETSREDARHAALITQAVGPVLAQELLKNHETEAVKAEPKACVPSMDENRVQRHLKSLQGRVLTIMEAILADKQQREAVKTIVNKEFRREMEKVGKYFLDPRCDQSTDED